MDPKIKELVAQVGGHILNPERAKVEGVDEVSFNRVQDLELFVNLIVLDCLRIVAIEGRWEGDIRDVFNSIIEEYGIDLDYNEAIK